MRFAIPILLKAVLITLLALAGCSDSDGIRSGQAASRKAPEPVATTLQAQQERPNSAPMIVEIHFEPSSPSLSDPELRAHADVSGAEGDSLFLRYAWKVDAEPAGNGPVLQLAQLERGQHIEVRVVATDGKDESPAAHGFLTLGNARPEISSVTTGSPDAIVAHSKVVVQTVASDRDGAALSLRYDWKVNGRPFRETSDTLNTKRIHRGDTIQVTVIASDGDLDSLPMASAIWTVANTVPEIVSVPAALSDSGVLRYEIEIYDADRNESFELSLEDAPAGADLDPATQTLSWTPTADQVGLHSFSIVADDGNGGLGRQQIELRVGDPASSPPAAPTQ